MVTGHNELDVAARRPVGLRNGRPRLHDHHAPAGLEVLGPLRPVPRLHGRLPRVEEAATATIRSAAAGSRPRGSGSSWPPTAAATRSMRTIAAQGAEVLQPPRRRTPTSCSGTGRLRLAAPRSTISRRCSARTPKTLGTLTEPREFNLMFKTIVGALGGEEDAAFLRPETAQGIFVNFKNVLRQHARADPVRHRADRQELPQRDHAAELHLPLARVRADGDRVLLPSRASRREWYRVLARPADDSGTPTWAWPASGCGCASTTRRS